MASKKGGSAFVRFLRLVLDKDSIEKTKRDTQKSIKDATDPKAAEQNVGRISASFNKMRLAAVAVGVALLTGLAAALRKVTQESIASQKAMAQQEAVLKSTGMAAGRTAQQLNEQAEALARLTTFEDDAITSAQNLLLTFKQIRGAEFDDAVEASLDLATALGTDASQAALQLGKALENPVAGLTALRRSGVSFSEAQKDVIKQLVETGRVAEAQRLILRELETQFGGSAAAARNTLGGALEGLRNSWNDLFEVSRERSAGIITAINGIADALPKVRDVFDGIFRSIAVGGANAAVALARIELVGARILQFSPLGTVMDMFAKGNMTKRAVDEATAQLEFMLKARDEVIAEMDALGKSDSPAMGVPRALEAIREAGEGAAEAIEKARLAAIRAQEEGIGFLVTLREMGLSTKEDEDQLLAIYGAIVATLKAGNLELEERVRLSKLAAEITGAFIGKHEVGERDAAGALSAGRAGIGRRVTGGLIADPGQPIVAPDIPDLTQPATETRDAWVEALQTVAAEAEITSGLLAAAFDSRGFLAGLAQIASAKVKENIARSVETLAGGLGALVFGDPTKLPIAAKASAGFMAAAGLWAALGGAAGGGGGGGGVGGASAARAPAGRSADSMQPQRIVTIYVTNDGVDPKNGRHQQLIGDTMVNVVQRVGSKITDGTGGLVQRRG